MRPTVACSASNASKAARQSSLTRVDFKRTVQTSPFEIAFKTLPMPRRAITAPALVLGHGIDLIHSFSDAQRLARQLPDARLIRTRTFAELWVRPARLTAEISEFLDRVWTGTKPQQPREEASQGETRR